MILREKFVNRNKKNGIHLNLPQRKRVHTKDFCDRLTATGFAKKIF